MGRIGALFLEGCENINISNNYFERLDGNVIFLSKYNRNITIYLNEIKWIGDNGIGTLGNTNQNDGTNKNQPRYINVSFNLIYELGYYEIQSSMFFQSKACFINIQNNVFFNLQRAAIKLFSHTHTHIHTKKTNQKTLYFGFFLCAFFVVFSLCFHKITRGKHKKKQKKNKPSFNDGFGGGDIVTKNLIFNTCRESGDHGPINSWFQI